MTRITKRAEKHILRNNHNKEYKGKYFTFQLLT